MLLIAGASPPAAPSLVQGYGFKMKAVILAGGLGTRLSEETSVRPKPMVEIGGLPILWHILKLYSQQGIHDFVICLGYKGYIIKEYFANYFLHTSDVTLRDKQQLEEFWATGMPHESPGNCSVQPCSYSH